MSITISNLLQLPSLREAKVIAGSTGLSKIVSSISVLEYADPSTLSDELFNNMEFIGSEIVISGFINIKDNVEAQCTTIRRLHEVGEVGLILFYVGIFLPSIDKRLVEISNQLGFPLIIMPEKRMDLRYSDVIVEVMETIFKDHRNDTYFSGEILERISLLPNHQRSMDTVLRMLSDRIHASIFLTDATLNILNLGTWPRTSNLDIKPVFVHYRNQNIPEKKGPIKFESKNDPLWINYLNLSHENTSSMRLIFIKEDASLTQEECQQCLEVIQLFVNIWSQHHGNIGSSELVRAILNDEPVKMLRLADILGIDVKSIGSMWVLKNKKIMKSSEELESFHQHLRVHTKKFLEENCKIALTDIFEEKTVAFMDTPNFKENSHPLAEELLIKLEREGFPCLLCLSSDLETTNDVRNAYILIEKYLESARIIYPDKPIITLQEVEFAKNCEEIIALGEASVLEKTNVLKPLMVGDPQQGKDWLSTLSTFLLDAQGSITLTAEKTFLHKNTIKYRIHRINERLNYVVTKMPESYALYFALAIQRLIRHH
ncbi:MAG: PucR family transcriptional regulator [Eubacteriaceae bacterium]